MLKRIKTVVVSGTQKGLRLLRKGSKIGLVTLVGILLLSNLIIPISRHLDHSYKRNAVYNLIVINSVGPYMIPVDQIEVYDVRREADGSICFKQVGESLDGCAKVAQYYLKPLTVR